MLQHRQGRHEPMPQIPASGLAPNSFSQGPAPTVSATSHAGTGATATFFGTGANDNAGVIQLNTGTGTTLGSQVTLVFASPFPANSVVITPFNTLAAGVATEIFAGLLGTPASEFIIFSTAPLAENTTYEWNYQVL